MREHRHVDTIHAALDAPVEGGRVHYAGGNDAMMLMGGAWGAPGHGMMAGPTPIAQIGSAVPTGAPGARPGGALVANTSGGQASLGKVQVTTAVLFAGAILTLVLLHKVGFKFSATVG